MHEHDTSHDDSRRQLTTVLGSDFTPPTTEPSGASVWVGFLEKTRSIATIEARLASDESAQLGYAVDGLLAPAPVTGSFKRFISAAVRRAHAWETTVDDALTPDRLGLQTGADIFDPGQAQELEAQTLRGVLFDIVGDYVVIPEDPGADDMPSVITRPSEYAESVDTLLDWDADYAETYGASAFSDIEPEAYADAAPRATVATDAEAEQLGWSEVIDELRKLRGTPEP